MNIKTMRPLTTIVLLYIIMISCTSQTKKEPNNKIKAITDLTIRLLGTEKAEQFQFEQIAFSSKKDHFEISSKDDKILIKGNSTVAMVSGLNWYLKYKTNCHISWEAKQLALPKKLPVIESPIIKTTPFEYSYYLNYCTFDYSMAFWDWERWEKEIDWMALNGVNLSLAMVGTEAIWKNTLEQFNFTKKEINDFIPGPAFNAWWLMGNLEGWGGPVSNTYLNKQTVLQQKIITRMKALGIQPVLPGFYGMVPTSLKAKYPKADIRGQGKWAGGFQRPAFLSPTDSLFSKMAKVYYKELKKLYGEVSYFSGDPFHEGGNSEGIDLPQAGKNIVYGMKSIFPKSTWLFQGWHGNPRKELLSAVNENDVLVLDLDGDNRPQWKREKNEWKGKPWIWATINNFGGNQGLFGRLDVVAEEPFKALNHPEYGVTLKGIGAIMEGIENNAVVYELLFDLKWREQAPNLEKWLSAYATRRYGENNENLNKAFQILRKTVYGQKLYKNKSQQGTSESILCARPALEITNVSSWGTSKLYYNPSELLKAWTLFINESNKFKSNQGFEYDLVDLTRQVLANYAQVVHHNLVSAYKQKNLVELKKQSAIFLRLIDSQDILLQSIDGFMLGKWIDDARNLATNESEKDIFEFNARTLITTWSFQDSNLQEYSHREWSGLLSDFYKPRWKIFFDYLVADLEGKKPLKPDFYAFEETWIKQTNNFTTKTTQNPLETSNDLYKRYFNEIELRTNIYLQNAED